ncbi:hypothetical protein [Bartonella sp. JB63]|nr:hypothetical protein [Bartonella sp. JB63]
MYTCDESFKFSDGTAADTLAVGELNAEISFISGNKIQRGLKTDQILS